MALNADGPDTSHYQTLTGQPPSSWRLWTHKLGEGGDYWDPTAPLFLKAAADAEVHWHGGFFWIRPDYTAKEQHDNLVRCLERVGYAFGDVLADHFFLQLDWERTYKSGPLGPMPLPPVAVAAVDEFNDRFDQKYGPGQRITYSADWVPGFVQWRAANPDEPLWYADYSSRREAQAIRYRADVLQWTSSYKHPCMDRGVKGFDMNHVYHPETLDRICRYTVPVPAPKPPPPINVTPPAPPPTPTNLEDSMTVACMVRFRAYANVWLIGAGPATHLTGELVEYFRAGNVPLIELDEHPQALECYLQQSGLLRDDLVST